MPPLIRDWSTRQWLYHIAAPTRPFFFLHLMSSTRTYSARNGRPSLVSSSPSELVPSPVRTALKRPLSDRLSLQNVQPAKRARPAQSSSKCSSRAPKANASRHNQKTFTQLHFSIDTSVLRTCPLCNLTFTKGAPDDENLHKAHCSRVQRGFEWGREEERESSKAGVQEVAHDVKLKNGKKGKIICFKADIGGKIGAKVSTWSSADLARRPYSFVMIAFRALGNDLLDAVFASAYSGRASRLQSLSFSLAIRHVHRSPEDCWLRDCYPHLSCNGCC